MSHKANEATALLFSPLFPPLFPPRSCSKQWCLFLNREYYLWLPKTELQPSLTTRAISERSSNTPHVPWSSMLLIMLTFIQISFTNVSQPSLFHLFSLPPGRCSRLQSRWSLTNSATTATEPGDPESSSCKCGKVGLYLRETCADR